MNIAELKKNHRFIFCTEIAERLIYWRALTFREYDIYIKIIELELTPIGKVQDLIFREICLDPSVIDQMNQTPAGLVPSIVNAALAISGNLLRSEDEMNRLNTDIDQMRQAVLSSPFEQFFVLICKAFPTYTPSDLEHLEYQEILRLLVMAEQITNLDEPIKLRPNKKESITDKLFKDKQRAESVDKGVPSAVDIRDILAKRQQDSLSMREAKKIEMERRLRQRGTR